MAEESGLLDVYRYDYQPSSGATHSQWHHIGRYNLVTCPNPLHKFHKIPVAPELGLDITYLHQAAEYVQRAFTLFDNKFGLKVGAPSALDTLSAVLDAEDRTGESEAAVTGGQ